MFHRPHPRVAALVTAVGAVAGVGLLTGGVANAAGTAGDNSGAVAVTLPVTVCGNSVSVLEPASGSCSPAAAAPAPTTSAPAAGAGNGILSGTTAAVDATAPVTVCGNSILGGSSSCAPSGASGASDPPVTTGGGGSGILGGNEASGAVSAPVTVCGNSVSALSPARSSCTPAGGTSSATPTGVATGTDGIASANGVTVGAGAPVTVCGNSVSVLEPATASCATAAAVGPPATIAPGTTTPAPGATVPGATVTGTTGTDGRASVNGFPSPSPTATAGGPSGLVPSAAHVLHDALPPTGAAAIGVLTLVGVGLAATGKLGGLLARFAKVR
jgi:hypothetical protein